MKYFNFANHDQSNTQPETLLTLIDLSPSMDHDDWKPSRKAGAISANKELIKLKQKSHPQDHVGIIGFSSSATLLHPPVCLNKGSGSLKRALKRNVDSLGTNFTSALELAEKHLCGRPSENFFTKALAKIFCEEDTSPKVPTRSNGPQRIIMLTDGEHTHFSSPLKVASRLKNAGVIIDCIGIGGSPADVDEDILKQIASQNPDGSRRYCFIGDQQQLLRKYQTLASHIRPV